MNTDIERTNIVSSYKDDSWCFLWGRLPCNPTLERYEERSPHVLDDPLRSIPITNRHASWNAFLLLERYQCKSGAHFRSRIPRVSSPLSYISSSHRLPRRGKPTPTTAWESVNQLTLSPPPSLTKPHGKLLPSSVSRISFKILFLPSPVATNAILIP